MIHLEVEYSPLEPAVVKSVLATGPQAHVLAQLRSCCVDSGLPSQEFLLETASQQGVETGQQFLFPLPLAVGRIDHNQPPACPGSAQMADVSPGYIHPALQPCPLHVDGGDPHSFLVRIVPDYGGQTTQGTILLTHGLLPQLLPDPLLVTKPTLEPVILSTQARCDTTGHERSLHQQGARATHGINQHPSLLRHLRPTGADKYRSNQVLLQRSLHLDALGTIPATKEPIPCWIYTEHHLSSANQCVDPHIRTAQVHRRPHSKLLPKLVHNRIFDPLCSVLGVGEVTGA